MGNSVVHGQKKFMYTFDTNIEKMADKLYSEIKKSNYETLLSGEISVNFYYPEIWTEHDNLKISKEILDARAILQEYKIGYLCVNEYVRQEFNRIFDGKIIVQDVKLNWFKYEFEVNAIVKI